MQAKRLLLTVALALGLGLALALLMALSLSPEVTHAWPVTPAITPSPPVTRPSGPAFVKPGGTGGWCLQDDPCGSIQYAINECEPGNGDTIYVAGGTYTGTGAAVITLTKPITLYGGWDGTTITPTVRDPDAHVTILDGENGRRVVYITGTVTPMLEGFTLQRGDASGLGGDPFGFHVGGAIYAYNTSPVITDCHIMSSTADFGGGLALYYGIPTLSNSTVVSNTANLGGGGVYLDSTPAIIVSNTVMINTANGSAWYNGGGGLYLNNSPAMISNNTIQGNHGFLNGGGLFLYQSDALMRSNTIEDNGAPSGNGGGVYMAMSAADLQANMILHNDAYARGGGLLVRDSAPFTLTNNIIAGNSTDYSSGLGVEAALYAVGNASSCQGTLLHNTFAENHSTVPWTIHVGSGSGPSVTLAFTNTIIDKPGGIWIDATGTVALDTTLWSWAILQEGHTVTGAGTIISSTNYYTEPGFTWSWFHIGPNSAAIDQGTNAGVMTDVDGESRPNGAGYDIGADEFYCYGLTGVTITGPTTGISGTAHTFTATVPSPTSTLPITYAWQATGPTPVTHTAYSLSDTVAFTWTIAGTQTVTVTTANCGSSDVATHTIAIRPQQPTIYLPVVLRRYS